MVVQPGAGLAELVEQQHPGLGGNVPCGTAAVVSPFDPWSDDATGGV